jgi:SagB-type dehydrogenase family enzyme
MKKLNPLFLAILIGAALGIAGGLGCGQNAPSRSGSAGAEVRLPQPRLTGPVSVEEALARRRSVRQFADKDLTIQQVSQLAWAAQGITEPQRGLRTAPSAGALYPLELYLVKRDGLFHYIPQGHKLIQLSGQDLRGPLSQAALGQSHVRAAALDVVIAAVYQRTRVKYGARAERYVHIEAGHVGQNIHLEAVALGLGSGSVGAFEDGAVAKVLGLPADETPIYIIAVGHRAE